ncbi:hypothetical protein A2716_05080 [candidate division WWE3 bacterium RIFCSPHIGHO2_01_FULL_40_23]|uniref:Triosephosphate isomerase n=1 Tax=candidate division WWE3 bacterium RIFCSPLOWO2_01_FULL_41_18 TaxID=1802625 RepID=A0A1F4VDL9_UNCKA|nr:MAG: hypothetical protein A2716_05080 [candidate division WWE3 bacterium RIFCSPHIGHO2_01_FULL_40_23]OGC55244.1 MAG: hypothetical protein A3A78_04690 [candidate division WWE3 bacterium RIFCSPLOWO2_01_FULL_41_18]
MKKLLIANWKQNKNLSEIKSWFDSFAGKYKANDNVNVAISPSLAYLSDVFNLIEKYGLSNVFVSAQDVSEFPGGAHTGEVSAFQVKDFCRYSIVGHSERRESFDKVLLKVENCLSLGVMPILCLRSPRDFRKDFDERIVLVWEDPLNISGESYKETPPDAVAEAISKIREVIGSRDLLYGGSVNEKNIDQLLDKDFGLTGFLVGQASLSPDSFVFLHNSIVKSL